MRVVLAAPSTIRCAVQVAASRLRVVVQDQSRAVHPRTAIPAVSDQTVPRAVTTSDAPDLFALLSPRPGELRVAREAAVFRKTVLSGAVPNVTALITENIRLEIDEVTDVLDVEAKETGVQTSESQVSRLIAPRVIEIRPHLECAAIARAFFQAGGRELGRHAHSAVSAALRFLIGGSDVGSFRHIKSQRTRRTSGWRVRNPGGTRIQPG